MQPTLRSLVFALQLLVALIFLTPQRTIAQPANDAFTAAWTLEGGTVFTNSTNADATKETGEPNHGGNAGARSVWFRWTAPRDGQVRIDTLGSSINTLLGVYTGNGVTALTTIAGNNDAPGLGNASLVEFLATQGTTYRIAVDVFNQFAQFPQFRPAGGPFQFNLQILASVKITSPTNNAVVFSPSPIDLTVEAEVGNPPVDRIELLRGNALLGTDDESPYNFTIAEPALGTNLLTAVAIDNLGLRWTSTVHRVAYLNAGATIITPVEGAVFGNTNNLTISAVTAVPAGAITNVTFLADDLRVASDNTPPFSGVWTNPVGGVHRLVAFSRDNLGNAYTSSPVTISIPALLIPPGSVWKYLADGTDQGTNWTRADHDDTTWPAGPAQLGYGEGDEATQVPFGPDPDAKPITTYFRHNFYVIGATNYTNLLISIKRDDGAILHLNGSEITRLNMPNGPVNHLTPGLTAADDGTTFFPANTPAAGRLREGWNTLAVEIHQDSPASDDLSFDLQLLATLYPRNQFPTVTLTSPAAESDHLAPPALTLTAATADTDGAITRVTYYNGDQPLGTATAAPFDFQWQNPPPGRHFLRALATDNLGSTTASAPVPINIYDATGTPFARITAPANGTTLQGPITLNLGAEANALAPIAQLALYANDLQITNHQSEIGNPQSSIRLAAPWPAPFGTHTLTAIVTDANGRRGTSAPVTLTITIPPTNLIAPTITSRTPAPGGNVTALTSARVTFSEAIQGIDPADLLINGLPATGSTNLSPTVTIFTFPQPTAGTITFTWAPGHGITDFGWPAPLPFDHTSPTAGWTATFTDRTPPTIIATTPARGTTVTNLTQVTVEFSEQIQGIDPADLLVNGVPAFALTPSPIPNSPSTTYTFSISQPPSGPVNFTWAAAHGITDLAAVPNPFVATSTNALWTATLDARTFLIQTNAPGWRYQRGLTEPPPSPIPNSPSPTLAWRTPAYDDSAWPAGPAPFYFGDPYGNAANPGTPLGDMLGNYTTLYLRHTFTVADAAVITNLLLAAQIDDGLVAWLNGVEILRVNAPAGELPYNATATATANEPNGNGAALVNYALPATAADVLRDGPNLLALHALNQNLTSGDFGINVQLYTYVSDPATVAPRLTQANPAPGTVFAMTNVTVRFSEPVTGVDAADLRINGAPATSLTPGGTNNTIYTFHFAQPPFGTVTLSWAANDDILDLDSPPKPFDGTAPGSVLTYTFLNPSTPTILSQTPAPGTINHLTNIVLLFSEPVTGVDASDLLLNGTPAVALTGSGANYTFIFPQPPYGPVAITWVADHGITDLDQPTNPFDLTRAGSLWNYTLVDATAPTITAVNPPRGNQVTNLTAITLTFSEPVVGVNATDLRINGVGAAGVTGSGAGPYTFSFPQPNATLVQITWLNSHGIRDLAPVPNPFDNAGPGATWTYTTPDNVAPGLAEVEPAPGVTLRSLNSIRLTFTEPVTGIDVNDLLINETRPLSVSGSGAGPYTFTFLPPTNGPVAVRWADTTGIADLATPTPNPFPGGAWQYTLDPAASFAGKVLINEIMFNTRTGRPQEEWIELRNVTDSPINLTGWRFNRGVDYTFPNVTIAPQGYLVVAADPGTFAALYPEAPAAVGPWSGRLANSEETISLETALGENVNEVHYATGGDWGQRLRGRGLMVVDSITRAGTTATITRFNHGLLNNDTVFISGADQSEYNGQFTVSGVNGGSFNITVTGTPATPATGRIIAHHVTHNGSAGWSWNSMADGFGNSIELVNSALGNGQGQNWRSSTGIGGTPGAANSVTSANIAPMVLDVTHFPPVPKSTDTVTITARVRDEQPAGTTTITLFHRDHTAVEPDNFQSVPMFDDGAHGDGAAGDGIYGAQRPPLPAGRIVEFYVQATDSTGNTRTWPAPVLEPNGTFDQLANALYQVDDENISNPMPAFRVVMTGTEDAVFPTPNRNSDAEVNATFISMDGDGTKVRYLAGVRIRGAGSRNQTPPNNRVNFPNDNPWNGVTGINLNGLYVHSQMTGAAISRKAGLPSSDARVIQYRINGINPAPLAAPGGGGGAGFGTFIMVLPVNGDLFAELYPDDGDGNVYRASTGNHSAQLNYLGTNPVTYLNTGYFKTSNGTENDWSDLIALTAAFTQTNAPLADYVAEMERWVNVPMWMRYFAVGTLMTFGETSLFNGRGDDYAVYRPLRDGRFVPFGHDFDTVFGQGDTTGSFTTTTNNSGTPTLFMFLNPPNTGGGGGFGGNAPNMPVLRRFVTNAVFAPLYFSELLRAAHGAFHPAELNPTFDQVLSGWGNGPSQVLIDQMKSHANNRRSVVLSLIPTNLVIGMVGGSAVPLNVERSTLNVERSLPLPAVPAAAPAAFTVSSPSVVLSGVSHAARTRSVLLNGAAAVWSPWEARWTNLLSLSPGWNRVRVESIDAEGAVFDRAWVDIRFDNGAGSTVSGALAADAVWSAEGGPWEVTANFTVPNGVTLTIQPGATVFLRPGVNFTVANGGRLLAVGAPTAGIRFAAVPGSGAWGGMTINGGPGSPESRVAHAHFEGNGDIAIEVADGSVWLSHLTFGNTARQYVSLDRASFVVEDCHFPSGSAAFELVHGSGGIKAGGRGIFRRCFWGWTRGYNDALDFTGGNRPGPVLQVLNCVFLGSDDDLLDLDSTDAWVEGNIFLHTHRNGSPDSASAVSGGADNADTSQITVVNNLFFDVDHAANAKQGNFYTLINNTIVRQTKVGSQDTNTAVVILADMNEQGTFTAQGAGMWVEGNIIADAENLTRHVTSAVVTFTNNLLHQYTGAAWSGPGGGNVSADPLFVRVPTRAETTNISSWAQAQGLWGWLALQPGSPGSGAGPLGRDLGALSQAQGSGDGELGMGNGAPAPQFGVTLSGVPAEVTALNSATIFVGFNRTEGIPTNGFLAGFANGSGYTHYRWRLDGGAWSEPVATALPIVLAGLANGPHFVEAIGLRDSAFWQDDAAFGADAVVTLSRTWSVDTSRSPVRLNELLASNAGALRVGAASPDAIELHNEGSAAVSLAGLRLSDDVGAPDRFTFPPGASIAGGGYAIVYASTDNGLALAPGTFRAGFTLPQSGGALFLFDAVSRGGRLLDTVRFGVQVSDLSIGRGADGAWGLTTPTFGAANRDARMGSAAALRINEWLAIGGGAVAEDFVELHNPGALPVALHGLFLSDEIIGRKNRHAIAPLSFIDGFGYQRFIADGNRSAGADHLNFSLNGDQGEIGLFDASLESIDCVYYQAQQPGISQGRSPNGSTRIAFFDTPTPGAPNPLIVANPLGGALVINEVLANNASGLEDGRTPDWVELYNGTTNVLDLGDLSLTDDSLSPRRYVFPAGVSLAPAGFLRVLCDPGSTAVASANRLVNTNFALKSTGGGLYLFDARANGGSLLTSIVYGLQAADLSIGRVPDGIGAWSLNAPSPGAANVAITALGSAAGLRVNEWMADPSSGDDWFEIYNPSSLPVSVGGLRLSDDLVNRTKHAIAPLSFIGYGTNAFQRFVADNNTGAGADHVNFSLRGAGEAVVISTAAGVLINGVPFAAQQTGVSEGRFPDGTTNVVRFPGTASPGESNWRELGSIVINEVLTHTDTPLEDAIELRNTTASPVNIGGWWLSDDPGTLRKYQIPPGTIVPANGFTVIYETVLTNAEFTTIPFALSSHGDEVVLSAATGDALTGFRTAVRFGAADNGITFGRHSTSDGRVEFVAQAARTLGADDPANIEEFRSGTGLPNSAPRVGPIVISEIMYHPPDLGTNDNTRDEYIELQNISTVPVPLAVGTNSWRLRDAVNFDFAPGTTLAPGGFLLVVSFDPVNNPDALAAFRARYNITGDTAIVGPYDGKLGNDSDDIELRKPGVPDEEGVDSILVERVRYFDAAPWPLNADGIGFSLHRSTVTTFGNDPANWFADAPSPGPGNSTGDTDNDGMPDSWESQFGFDPFNPLDAGLDSDGDGLTNVQEFQMGSNPRDATSGVSISSIAMAVDGTNVVLTFTAFANQTYTVEAATSVTGPWAALQDVAAEPVTREVTVTTPATGPMKFFRLRTPWRFATQGATRIDSIQTAPGNNVKVSFTIAPGQACTLEHRASLSTGTWGSVTNIPSAGVVRSMEVLVPRGGGSGFFRLRTP